MSLYLPIYTFILTSFLVECKIQMEIFDIFLSSYDPDELLEELINFIPKP